MYNIGDLVIYSAHGICKIDDICEKTVSGMTATYYVLRPLDDYQQLTISIPVNNDKVVMSELIHKEDAQEILDTFREPGLTWNDRHTLRYNLFSEIISTGNRKEIARVLNTLMRKKRETEFQGKKLFEQDRKLLNNTQHILFKELALSLNISYEEFNEMVIKIITA